MSSTTFLWIVIFMVILGGITLVIRNYRKQMQKPDDDPPVQQEQEPQLTRQQQLVQELEALREENARKAWRITCTTRFWNLSRSIQEIAALDASKADICSRLQIILTNNSVKSLLLALPDKRPEPIAISPAIREADVEKLEAIVRYERDQAPETLLDIPWEKLLKDTASCLNLLIQAVDEEKADVCRGRLAQLETVLEKYGIRAVYYDEAKSQVSNPQEDYLVGSNWEIPVLYACDTRPWIRVGEMGAAHS